MTPCSVPGCPHEFPEHYFADVCGGPTTHHWRDILAYGNTFDASSLYDEWYRRLAAFEQGINILPGCTLASSDPRRDGPWVTRRKYHVPAGKLSLVPGEAVKVAMQLPGENNSVVWTVSDDELAELEAQVGLQIRDLTSGNKVTVNRNLQCRIVSQAPVTWNHNEEARRRLTDTHGIKEFWLVLSPDRIEWPGRGGYGTSISIADKYLRIPQQLRLKLVA